MFLSFLMSFGGILCGLLLIGLKFMQAHKEEIPQTDFYAKYLILFAAAFHRAFVIPVIFYAKDKINKNNYFSKRVNVLSIGLLLFWVQSISRIFIVEIFEAHKSSIMYFLVVFIGMVVTIVMQFVEEDGEVNSLSERN